MLYDITTNVILYHVKTQNILQFQQAILGIGTLEYKVSPTTPRFSGVFCILLCMCWSSTTIGPPQSCNTMLNQVNKVNYLHLNLILDQRDSHGPNKVCRTLNLRCVILLSDQFIILCIVIRFLCDCLYCPCVTLMIKILRMCLHRGHLC